MKVTKSSVVRNILATQPNMSTKDIAKLANCDISLVGQLRKVKSVAKPKMGRPRKVVAPRQVSIVEASSVLKYLVDDVKDLCISFDHRQGKVEVLWFEELFKVDIDELPKTMESIKFLANRMIDFTSEANHDNV
jgi:hypothetical protein